ncbi:MAG: response regulator [Chloroflexi bacterium]|nr:response regulator [Chloroflexota bacterium]MBT7082022.1 response regulator [Chloroflexota bacterium]MBT7289693.1 response regulator [Chloroflexota bacterium]
MKVLIVEDDPGTLEVMRMCFEVYKPEIEIISSNAGRKGIAMAQQEKPDAMIVDLGLPDIDGSQVIEKVRQKSSIPIIVASARTEDRFIKEALALGANDYLVKPFDPQAFIDRFEKVLEQVYELPKK